MFPFLPLPALTFPHQLQWPELAMLLPASQAHFQGREGAFPACQWEYSALNIPPGTEKSATRAAAAVVWGNFSHPKHLQWSVRWPQKGGLIPQIPAQLFCAVQRDTPKSNSLGVAEQPLICLKCGCRISVCKINCTESTLPTTWLLTTD